MGQQESITTLYFYKNCNFIKKGLSGSNDIIAKYFIKEKFKLI